MSTDLIIGRIKRRERRKGFLYLPDEQIAVRQTKRADDGVSRALKSEIGTRSTDVRRADKKMWRDRRAEKNAPRSFVLPATVHKAAAGRSCVRGRIPGIE